MSVQFQSRNIYASALQLEIGELAPASTAAFSRRNSFNFFCSEHECDRIAPHVGQAFRSVLRRAVRSNTATGICGGDKGSPSYIGYRRRRRACHAERGLEKLIPI